MKNIKLLRIVSLVAGAVLLIVAFTMYHAPMVGVKLAGFDPAFYTGYELAFREEPVAGILVAWIFSLVLLIAAVCSLALFALDLAGVFKLKLLKNKMIRLCLAGCVCLFALATGILLFLAPAYWGTTAVSSTVPGAGAILGGIFTLIGGCGLSFGIVLPALKK